MQNFGVMASRLLLAGLYVAFLGGCSRLSGVDGSLFPDPEKNAITFWGHACLYIDVGGFGIVTDPVFERFVINRWRKVPAPPPGAYHRARVVLISHAHPDHLSPPTIETFPEGTVVLCPEPSAEYVEKLKQEVVIMRPGDVFEFSAGKITAVPAKHSGGRWALTTGTDGRALGYVIESENGTVYYSGDTNFFDGFRQVGETFAPDIAIINVNGHLHSNDAVHAAWATRAPIIIPAHFGAYGNLIFGTRTVPRDYEELSWLLGSALVTLDLAESFPLPGNPGQERATP